MSGQELIDIIVGLLAEDNIPPTDSAIIQELRKFECIC